MVNPLYGTITKFNGNFMWLFESDDGREKQWITGESLPTKFRFNGARKKLWE